MIVRMLVGSVVAWLGAASMAGRAVDAGAPCATIAALVLPTGSVTRAEEVSAGAFAPSRSSQRRLVAIAACVLPNHRDAPAFERLRHHDRDVVTGIRLEWQVSGGRERRVQRLDQLRGTGHGRDARLRREFH